MEAFNYYGSFLLKHIQCELEKNNYQEQTINTYDTCKLKHVPLRYSVKESSRTNDNYFLIF